MRSAKPTLRQGFSCGIRHPIVHCNGRRGALLTRILCTFAFGPPSTRIVRRPPRAIAIRLSRRNAWACSRLTADAMYRLMSSGEGFDGIRRKIPQPAPAPMKNAKTAINKSCTIVSKSAKMVPDNKKGRTQPRLDCLSRMRPLRSWLEVTSQKLHAAFPIYD